MIKSIHRKKLSTFYGAEGLNGHHKYAVIDRDVIYGLGRTESSAMKNFKNECFQSNIDIGEYTIVEIEG